MKLTKRSVNWLKKLKETALKQEVRMLIDGDPVEVGYRSTCGRTDPTMKNFELFCKFLKALESQGVFVSKTNVKHKNAYATNNGGFWDSYVFKIGGE